MVTITILKELFKKQFKENAESIELIPASGSGRKYYRLKNKQDSAIGVFGPDIQENKTYLYLSEHFYKKSLSVPKILQIQKDDYCYLIEDFGNISLFKILENKKFVFDSEIKMLYKRAIKHLIRFQINGIKGLDDTFLYPKKQFDDVAIRWDLNYFKYYFLKTSGIEFNEDKLENDFNKIIKYFSKANKNYFMYRDFQARNILVKNDELFFIDFQGGRKGFLQYDLVSLLYQAKANIPIKAREELKKFYIDEIKKLLDINIQKFDEQFEITILLRSLQVLGAYGFRGHFEKKNHFIQSIPFALKNLRDFLKKHFYKLDIRYLEDILIKICEQKLKSEKHLTKEKYNDNSLIIRVNSFSYLQNGIPNDETRNGGGFVFDCRALPNPGRDKQYKHLTGNDVEVIEFLEESEEVEKFINNTFCIIKQSLINYLSRDFNNLMISFGCTGGQHRSVYCANKIAEMILENWDVEVQLNHINQRL